jgi:uncharacterized repeat protein (TIGR01451 family)
MRGVTLRFASAAVFCLLIVHTASAQSGETGNVCVRDYQPGAVCKANDVRIELLEPITIVEDCDTGTIGEAEVIFEMLVSAEGSPDRFDVGTFLALDGGSALSGDSCFHDFLEPPLTTSPTFGDDNGDMVDDVKDGPWPNLEVQDPGDTCGDIVGGTQNIKTLQQVTVACVDSDFDGSVDVSVCSSWGNNASGTCAAVTDAFPGTNAKCSCSVVELGIPPASPPEEPAVAISKTPLSQVVLSGDDAVFTITVDNPGTADLTDVGIVDPPCDVLSGPSGDDGDDVLEPDETWTYTCTVQDVTSDFTNDVTVNATAPQGLPLSASASADVFVISPAISVDKSPPVQVVASGADAVFTIEVENTGDDDLDDVQVDDALCTSLTGPEGDDGDGSLAPGEVWTYTCTVENVTEAFVNVATVTATPSLGPDVSDAATAAVEIGENPFEIPTLSGWALALLAAVLAGAGLAVLARGRFAA